jgi:hypothetical protein
MDRADLTLSASGPGVSERDSVISIRNGVYKPPEGAPAGTIRKDRNEARIAGLVGQPSTSRHGNPLAPISAHGLRKRVHASEPSGRYVVMKTGLRWLLPIAMVMVSGLDRLEAQAPASASTSRFRVEWTADPARGRWQRVCGYIYNDTPDAPREVRLLVEGRDQAERVIDAQVVPVLGYITPWGRTYFCSTATAGAARYSVTVIGAEVTSDR